MSLIAFQAGLARLITNPDFRDSVRAGGSDALGPDLTLLERKRLCHIAEDPGLDINRTLHKGFRLGKLRAMLPLTCRALGTKRLSREVATFWAQRAPSSFYFIAEALEFCDFLCQRKLHAKYLGETLAYERAVLELERPRTGSPPEQVVHFRHDPSSLLSTLAAHRQPRAIAKRSCTAVGSRGEDGRVAWRLVDTRDTRGSLLAEHGIGRAARGRAGAARPDKAGSR